MATTAELLQGLIDSKAAIVAALEAKGVIVPEGAKFSELAAMVEAIEGGGGGDIEAFLPAWEYDCPTMTSLVVPEGVTRVGANAFDGCFDLASLTIPRSVTTIGSYAFNYCTSLTSLTIPGSVTSIGQQAFYGCPQTCGITFDKTMSEVSGMENYPWSIATGAVIHCTDGDLTVS